MGAWSDRRHGRLIAYGAVALLIAFAGVRYLARDADGGAPGPVVIDPAGGRDRRGAGDAGSEQRRLYVHVAGAVRDEGLYRMRAGSRVGAAIDRAGGVRPSAELTGVNLAAELQDGQQVVVPRRGEATAAEALGAGGVGGAAPDAPLSLAQATPEQLDASVEGIGPVLASAIIEFRDENGGVESIDELREVGGIGEERLATLRDALVP